MTAGTRFDNLAADVARRGFAFLPEAGEDAWARLVEAGGGAEVLPIAGAVTHLVPRGAGERGPNTYSGNFGLGEFPLHTDLAHWWLPPRFLLLRCLRGSPEVATRVLRASELIRCVGGDRLRCALVEPRRPTLGRRPLLHMLEASDTCAAFRWDPLFLRPATEASAEVWEAVTRCLALAAPQSCFLTRPGDILVVDNWAALHGRSAAPPSARSRHVERCYLRWLA